MAPRWRTGIGSPVMRRSFRFVLVASLAIVSSPLAALGFVGCSSSSSSATAESPEAGTGDGGAVLEPNVTVLSDSVAAQATLGATTLTFPAAGNDALLSIGPGAILVSGYQDGFLVRVQSVQQIATQAGGIHPLSGSTLGSILFNIVPASLTDAIASADFDWTYTPAPLAADATALLAGTATLGWSLTASTTLTPSIEVQGHIRDGAVTGFQTTFTTVLADTVSESISFNGKNSWGSSVPIASASQRFVEYLPTPIGLPFPVVGNVTLAVSAGYAANITAQANVTFGSTCSVTHTDDVAYDPASGWAATDTSTKQCTNQAPALSLEAEADAKVYFTPSVQLTFWGVGGPSLSAEIGVKASATTCAPPATWSINGYVSGTVGANVSVLGVGAQFSHDLGEVDYPIASGNFTLPAACGCCDTTGTCQQGTSNDACGSGGEMCVACTSPDTCGGNGTPQSCGCGPDNCDGCCDAAGACQPGTSDDVCGSGGEACGACTSPDTCGGGGTPQMCGECDESTCPSGCCDGNGVCQGGSSDGACGTGGAACLSCQSPAICESSQCSCPTDDAGPAAACGSICCETGEVCGDAAKSLCCPTDAPVCGSSCCPSAADGGTAPVCVNPATGLCCAADATGCGSKCCPAGETCGNAATELCCAAGESACGPDCCPNGQCANPATGACTVCDAASCPTGCCDSSGKCQPGNVGGACGTGGAACATCTGSASCVGSLCRLPTECGQCPADANVCCGSLTDTWVIDPEGGITCAFSNVSSACGTSCQDSIVSADPETWTVRYCAQGSDCIGDAVSPYCCSQTCAGQTLTFCAPARVAAGSTCL